MALTTSGKSTIRGRPVRFGAGGKAAVAAIRQRANYVHNAEDDRPRNGL
jgi:hypothetical protein